MRIQFLYPLCLRCGSLSVGPSLFCRGCENQFLFPRLKIHTRTIKVDERFYDVEFLLHWVPKESDSLSELVYLLKNRLSFPVWKFYSEKFFQREEPNNHQKLKTAIIPVPGSRQGKTAYHTRHFARAWQDLTSGEVISCLVNKSEKSEQKDLSLEERGRTQLHFLEDFTTVIEAFDRIILIDDIITSGHTLQASLMAIKPHLRPGCVVEIKALLSRDKI